LQQNNNNDDDDDDHNSIKLKATPARPLPFPLLMDALGARQLPWQVALALAAGGAGSGAGAWGLGEYMLARSMASPGVQRVAAKVAANIGILEHPVAPASFLAFAGVAVAALSLVMGLAWWACCASCLCLWAGYRAHQNSSQAPMLQPSFSLPPHSASVATLCPPLARVARAGQASRGVALVLDQDVYEWWASGWAQSCPRGPWCIQPLRGLNL
jgi:hypothetical protein